MSNRSRQQGVPPLLGWAAAISWRLLVVAGVVAVIGFLVVRLALVIVPALIALLIASVLHPPAARLIERRVPAGAATLIVFAAVVLAVGGTIFFIAPGVAAEVGDFSRALSAAQDGLTEQLDDAPFGLTRSDVNAYVERVGEQVSQNRDRIVSGVLGAAAGFVQIAAGTALMIVLAFFFVKDRDPIWEWIVRQYPRERRDDVREAGRRAWEVMQGYVRGITIIALVDAVLIGIALLIVGVPLVLPLSVLVFLGAFVPIVGAFVSGLVAVAVAFLTGGITDAAIIAVAIVAIQQVEGNVLQPVVMGRTVKLHPVVILITVASGVIVAGVAGGFLAVPLVATATAAGSYLKEQREERTEDERAASQPGAA